MYENFIYGYHEYYSNLVTPDKRTGSVNVGALEFIWR